MKTWAMMFLGIHGCMYVYGICIRVIRSVDEFVCCFLAVPPLFVDLDIFVCFCKYYKQEATDELVILKSKLVADCRRLPETSMHEYISNRIECLRPAQSTAYADTEFELEVSNKIAIFDFLG
jgi:hypothetical protein